jgi:hypothetical protein
MSLESGQTFSAEQCRDLQALTALMIPASEEFAVPGADDPAIFADITGSVGLDFVAVREALQALAAMSSGCFADLDPKRRPEVAKAFLSGAGENVATLSRVVLHCYYRDDRVVRALGLEPRPPFPRGHTLEQGDWSLLDAVRGRPSMWRDAP